MKEFDNTLLLTAMVNGMNDGMVNLSIVRLEDRLYRIKSSFGGDQSNNLPLLPESSIGVCPRLPELP